jgi:hypothetical protein
MGGAGPFDRGAPDREGPAYVVPTLGPETHGVVPGDKTVDAARRMADGRPPPLLPANCRPMSMVFMPTSLLLWRGLLGGVLERECNTLPSVLTARGDLRRRAHPRTPSLTG